jgi:hypothetical protein
MDEILTIVCVGTEFVNDNQVKQQVVNSMV